MEKNICGVYKITNLKNEECYIGCSLDIAKRWSSHKTRAFNTNKEYDKKLYKAMREYGIDNFNIEVIEECCQHLLFEREKFYIETLDSINGGYNISYGEDNHGNAKLSSEDIIKIRIAYSNKERKNKVYENYRHLINETGFHKIWNGYTWKKIMMEVYTEENRNFHKNNTANKGSLNGTSKITEKDVINIRLDKKADKPKLEVYEKYKNKLTLGSFNNVWGGHNWKHITV